MLYITFCFHLLLFSRVAKNVLDNRCGTLKIFGMCGNMLRDHLSCNTKGSIGFVSTVPHSGSEHEELLTTTKAEWKLWCNYTRLTLPKEAQGKKANQ